jgi:hypothetical protein
VVIRVKRWLVSAGVCQSEPGLSVSESAVANSKGASEVAKMTVQDEMRLLSEMKVANLRILIESAGLSHSGCLTKRDLLESAAQALQSLGALRKPALAFMSPPNLRNILDSAGVSSTGLHGDELLMRASQAYVLIQMAGVDPIDRAVTPAQASPAMSRRYVRRCLPQALSD